MTPIDYTIQARAYNIVGIAAHNFWVLRDENGHVLGQMHGLATNANNEILPIGRIGDHLKFYHFGPRALSFGLDPGSNRNYIKHGQITINILSDSPEQVLARWDHAVKALPYLNALDLTYTPFGILSSAPVNSNTAYFLLGRLMGLPAPLFPRYWQPGWRNTGKILTADALEAMKYPGDPPEAYLA